MTDIFYLINMNAGAKTLLMTFLYFKSKMLHPGDSLGAKIQQNLSGHKMYILSVTQVPSASTCQILQIIFYYVVLF